MLGIAIFLFLGAWIIITLLCMFLGWFLGRRLPFSWGKWFGLFLGFMLPTGYYLVSWTAEYFMMQARVSELCKTQGGTKIYISPEAYRQMIGESEWQHLYAMNQSIYAGDKESHLQFAGKAYTPVAQRTPRIRAFQFRQEIEGIHETDMLYYDDISRQALFQTVTFDAVAPPFLYYAGGLKFWLNDIRDCAIDTLPEDERHFVAHYANSDAKKEN